MYEISTQCGNRQTKKIITPLVLNCTLLFHTLGPKRSHLMSRARDKKIKQVSQNTYAVDDGRYAAVFVTPTREEHKTDCLICCESLERGVVAALPYCDECNLHHSVVAHKECLRKLLRFDVPLNCRPHVKHVICAREYTPAPLTFCYFVGPVNDQLDEEKVPAGRCSDCNLAFDTRAALQVHKNPSCAAAKAQKMSASERRKREANPQVFTCPRTYVPCRHCGVADEMLKTRAHQELCGALSPSERAKFAALLRGTQVKATEIARRDENVRHIIEEHLHLVDELGDGQSTIDEQRRAAPLFTLLLDGLRRLRPTENDTTATSTHPPIPIPMPVPSDVASDGHARPGSELESRRSVLDGIIATSSRPFVSLNRVQEVMAPVIQRLAQIRSTNQPPSAPFVTTSPSPPDDARPQSAARDDASSFLTRVPPPPAPAALFGAVPHIVRMNGATSTTSSSNRPPSSVLPAASLAAAAAFAPSRSAVSGTGTPDPQSPVVRRNDRGNDGIRRTRERQHANAETSRGRAGGGNSASRQLTENSDEQQEFNLAVLLSVVERLASPSRTAETGGGGNRAL